MRIVASEWFKVYSKKSVLFLFVLLILLNGILLYIGEHSSRNPYQPKAYRELYKSIEGLTNMEALTKLEREQSELYFIMELTLMNEMENTDEEALKERFPDLDISRLILTFNRGEYLKYTDSLMKEIRLYEQLIYEVKEVHGYGEYLQKIEDDANTMTTISIFTKPGTFAYRNIKKTPSDFEHLKGNILKADVSKGVKMATESLPTDLIAVFLIMIVCISLVTREKEQGCLNLVKTSYRGRLALIASKYLVAILSCVLIELLLYVTNFALAYYTYGFGDMGRLIQSVSGYIGSNLEINVTQFFALFLLSKLAVYILISSLLFLVCLCVNTSVGVYLVNALLFGINAVLYYTIPSSSVFAIAKYLNLVAFLDTYKIFANYRNLNFFGFPINYIPVFVVAVTIGTALLALMSFIVFSKTKQIKVPSKLAAYLKLRTSPTKKIRISGSVRVFSHELYKIMISNKALLVLCALVAFQIYSYQPLTERYSTVDELYYKRYMLELEGEITQEKEDFLKAEEQRYEQLTNQLQDLYMNPDENSYKIEKLSRELAGQKAFYMVLDQYTYLKEMEDEYSLKGWFLYDSGYTLLTAGESSSKDLQLALLSLIIVISSFSSVFSCEYQSGMINIILPSRHGRRRSFYTKLLISLIISTLIFAIVYLPYFYNVFQAYGTRAIHAPAFSMSHLHNLRANISILGYLILLSLIRLIGLIGAMMLVFAISVKLKSTISTALVSTLVLVMPLLLSLLNINIFDYILLTPLLSGNILLKDYSINLFQKRRMIYLSITLISTIVIYILSYLSLKSSYKRSYG